MGKKVVLKRTRHGRVIITMGMGGHCKSGCSTPREGGVHATIDHQHPAYKSLEGLLSVLGGCHEAIPCGFGAFHVWDLILSGLLTRFCLFGLPRSEGPPHCSIRLQTSVHRFPGLRRMW